MLLFAIDAFAEIIHIGVFQVRKEAEERRRKEEEEEYLLRKEKEQEEFRRKIVLSIAQDKNHH